MKYLLGIDLGTSSVKALLLAENGNVAAICKEEYGINIPEKGYAEQDSSVWKEKTFKVIKDAIAKSGILAEDIECIGLSGQMHGTVLLGNDNEVIRPAIIWSDQRTSRQVSYINNSIGKARIGEYISNPIATGFFVVSMMWLRDNEPESYEKIKKAIFPKDYIRFELTGEIGTEITDASGSGLFDVSTARWNSQLIEFLKLESRMLPEISRPYDIAGLITAKASEYTGLKEGTPVVFGGSDHSMQALGTGITKPGMVSVNIGTGGQIYTPIQHFSYDKQLRLHKFCHAVPGVWNIIGATLGAGLSLKWFMNNILKVDNTTEIEELMISSKAGSNGIVYLPYIAGERTPHMDPDATGMFYGLALSHNQADMLRAVMEGVAFSFKECFEIFGTMGIRLDKLVASGGGASVRTWRQIIADVFDCRVYTSQTVEEAAFGAAMLAGVGCGVFGSFEEADNICIRFSNDVVFPNKETAKVYKKNFKLYKEVYKATAHLNKGH